MESNSDKHINLEEVKKLGKAIESGFTEELRDSDDELLNSLFEYRNIKRESERKTPVPSNDVWDAISQQMDADKKEQPAAVHSLKNNSNKHNSNLRIWFSAAAAVLIAFLGIYYFTRPATTHLLAESSQSKIIYTTSDGSKITLRPYSKLYLMQKSSSEMKYKLDGEAFFNVVHNPNRQFIVEAGSGEVRVLGTRFNVSDWGHVVQLYLQKGSVYFQNKKNHKHVILKPGESCTITQNGTLLKPQKQNNSTYLDWLHNVMTFNHQKVKMVFDELDQHYNITIQTDNLTPKFLSETITGQIHLRNLHESLKNLGLVLGGQFKKSGPNTYKFSPNK